jgi:hypothetical protein
MSLKADMAQWIEEHIECCAYDIKDFKEPFTKEELRKLKIPCAQLKILYDLANRFDIELNYVIYNKYEKFANIKIS